MAAESSGNPGRRTRCTISFATSGTVRLSVCIRRSPIAACALCISSSSVARDFRQGLQDGTPQWVLLKLRHRLWCRPGYAAPCSGLLRVQHVFGMARAPGRERKVFIKRQLPGPPQLVAQGEATHPRVPAFPAAPRPYPRSCFAQTYCFGRLEPVQTRLPFCTRISRSLYAVAVLTWKCSL